MGAVAGAVAAPPKDEVGQSAEALVDTFLELAEPDVWLSVKDRSDWKMAFSPALTLWLVLRAGLVRALDGEEIRHHRRLTISRLKGDRGGRRGGAAA